MNLPEKNIIIQHKKNIRSVKKTRLSLRPLSTSIRMLLTGSIVLGGLTVSSNATAALPLPKPPGAWATRSALALPQVSASWSRINDKLWRSGTTEAQYGDKTLTVKQKDGKVILSWDSFDIDVSHLVEFKQPNSNSIALNRISNQAPPSRILGTLKANGQIYLINNNGFLFGANSVVDVNTLVVSTLNISDDVFKRGITKVFTGDGSAAFNGNGDVYLRDPKTRDYIRDAAGDRLKIGIHVDKGAQISSDNSGRVIMVAPEITNRGTITSPDGQVILVAATDQVYLQETDSGDSVRGLNVGVKTGGEVSNQGNIITPRGNATLIGFAVNQQGLISATTSVRVNGSIVLLAGEKGGRNTARIDKMALLPATSTTRTNEQDDGLGTVAKVTLADGSVTRVLPEIKDKMAMAGSSKPSSIKMLGEIIHFKSGSAVIAPSGEVNVWATDTPVSPAPTATENDSAIIMDPGSLVDVAGLRSVEKTMESNVIEVELRANVLADAPVQRDKNSFLYGKKISVDIREGTPMADIQPALDGIKTTVAERSVEGGKVGFSSQGAVVLKEGSEVNISGGAIHFKAGYINTTQLLGENGKTYDISKASPDLRYTNILGQVSKEYKKWGVTKTWKVAGPFNKGRFESAYVDGKKAGTFTVDAHRMRQDGDIVAKTVNGRYQRLARQRAAGGSLDINLAFLGEKYQTLVFQNNKDLNRPDLDKLKPAQDKESATSTRLLIDADSFRRNGLQNVTYTTNGEIVLSKNMDMQLSDGGSFSLTSKMNNINLDGKITGHGTDISLKATLGDVVLGENTLIDTSGRWVNDSLAAKPVPDFEGVFIDAGKVTVTSELASVIMNKGSLIRANSGAWLTDEGEQKTGKGGDVSLVASSDPNANGTLILEGTFEGFSFADSGTLSLNANEFRFAPMIPDNGNSDPSAPGPVYIPETFVEKSGFSSYNFTSTRNGITFESGVLLKPSQQNLVLNGRDVVSSASASDVSSVSIRQRLADEIRKPVNLGFTYDDPFQTSNLQQTRAVYMQLGSRIRTEVGATVSFSSSSSLYMNGVVEAPAGRITLNITDPAIDPGYIPAQGIWLGAGSVLSTTGAFVPTSSVIPGLRQGRLLDGGEVVLTAKRGFIVMDKAALIDVSGASAILDQPDTTYQGVGVRLQEMLRASNAGEVSLAAAEGIISEGTILGWANTGLGAEGGRLKIEYVARSETNASLKTINSFATPFIETPRKIMIGKARLQGLMTIPRQGEAIADEVNGYAWLDSGLLNQSGFDSIELKTAGNNGNNGNIVFKGDNLIVARREVKLTAPVISWQRDSAGDTGLVAILSPYVALGSATSSVDAAVSGDGQLQVEANMIDLIGKLSLPGFDKVQLNSNTDIRVRGQRTSNSKSLNFQGQWNSRGRLELSADRVYPASLSDYSINADEVVISKHQRNGEDLLAIFGRDAATIIDNISRSHSLTPLLSAGGRLAIKADTITQAGELRAPLGEISLQADSLLSLEAGSLTSTSAQGQVIPLGQTAQSGLDWQYNFSKGDTLRILRPSEKRILLSSDDVRLNKGAVIDMNGGGDLQAWEFIKGPGGSHDIFDSSGAAFAVFPGLNRYAPYDPGESEVAAGLKPGDTVYLSGVGDLPTGEYARLPARYALLDGAYLVTPLSGYTGMIPGETTQLMDRTPVVAGQYRIAGTGIHDQDWNGFKVETRQQARLHSEILLTRANRFYTDKALADETLVPFLPQDAGQLGITALSRLDLAGELRNQAEGAGRGGRLDIEATNLAVVNRRSTPGVNSDRVELLAGELNQLDMESLLLGGIRKQTDAGTKITVATRTVSVETNTGNNADKLDLQGTEILLAAQDRIDLKPGVTVQAKGKGGLGADTLIVKGDGALVRVSAGAQVSVSRTSSKGDKGTINLDKGAWLAASSAVLLDASHEINISGKLKINHGSLNLGAGRINLGDAPISATGLLLNRDLLDSLNLRELVMTSRQGVYTYGDVDLNFDSIVFDGAGIVSQGNAGNRLTIQSDRLRFTNSGSDKVSKDDLALASGDAFTIKAREIELGKGDYTLAGFKMVSMVASEQIVGKGKSTISIKADVNLKTPLITTGGGADTRIDATDQQFVINQLATDKPLAAAGIGGRLSISADSISDRSTILLPAGILELNATHKLLIDNALIDVSGASKSFQDEIKTAPGGSVTLASEQAGVELTKTARINLSAADEGGDAGSLKVDTPQGEFIWQGTVSATAAKGKGGRFELNEQSMSSPFSVLNSKLAGAGFDEAVSLRLGLGDIAIAQMDTLRAHEVTLTADTGNVNVAGAIDARGKDGGRVELFAGDNVTLSGRIDASATADDGGMVKLTTLDNDQDGIGEIDVTGNIDVSSGGKGKGGEVWYRARRIDSNNDGQNDEVAIAHAGTVTGAAVVNYVPVRIYDGVSVVDKNRINQWQSDNQAFMAFSDAIASRLNANGNNHGRILPSSFVRSNGDMTIDTNIDFSDWRYGKDNTPGDIIFSAKNNLLINADISDGFKDTTFYGGRGILDDKLMTGESWFYSFVAGADRQSANPMDVNKGIGNITLADDTKIRTGTGSLDIASGNDLILSNPASVMYTAGQATDGGFSLLNFGFLRIAYTEYPRDGGDIRIRTGGNMKGAVSKQSIRSWLTSTGNWSRNETHQGELPTSWGLGLTTIKFRPSKTIEAFQRGIGAFGGGNVDIKVAGDMQDVSVMIPTSGRPLGKSLSPNPKTRIPDFGVNRVKVSGSGSLEINVGGNINGGIFYLGRGEGAMRSDGGLLQGSNDRYPVFAMGDTQFNIVSRKELGIGAVFDPLMEKPTSGTSYFFRYSAASALSLTSVAGDIHLANNAYYDDSNKSGYNDAQRIYKIYPASFSASSLSGDVVLDKDFTLFPSPTGQLELLAADNIKGIPIGNPAGTISVFMPDADPALLLTAKFPVRDSALSLNDSLYSKLASYAVNPLHTGDDRPTRIVAESGSISRLQVTVPKKAEIYAGQDIRNSSFFIQNIAGEDRSRIVAGRDFRYDIPRQFNGSVNGDSRKVEISGPGQLIVQAGRNIDLGASVGIRSVGNTNNPALADRGADVILIAGVKNNVDYAGFAETYINQSDKYVAVLRTFVNDGVINFDQTAGLAVPLAQADSVRKTFAGFNQQKQQAFLRELFLHEIRDVGVKSAKAGGNFYQPAYDAIASLFPGSYAGDIKLFFSQITTLDGGDIQLLVPGGGVNAGLASSAGFSKGADRLGIIVQREGKIDAFVRDNFAVNISRVFTLGGGDIMLFASDGDIDAGRGAKSSLAAPPPTVTFDQDGNPVVEFPPAVQGSGIRTFASGKTEAGDVYLFAPQGKIDAGDAGIGGNDITLGAPTIIGSGNIDIGGVSVGVPTASVSLAAGLTGVSNLSASSNKVAEESTSSIGKLSENSGFASTPMGFLNVELVGFGGGVSNNPGSKSIGKITRKK